MAKSVNDTINELKSIRDSIPNNKEIKNRLDEQIANLEEINSSRLDKYIERAKKVSEILAVVSKILYEYFKGGP